jgi:hypothetical protein
MYPCEWIYAEAAFAECWKDWSTQNVISTTKVANDTK